ncbi:TetR/AcrR family transcriptional regulator [Actinocrispum wychmicini]|uniref:TetR family transcriptional regulator n=1 Tax=Actinocrispum wychmicini TaxID=1213861 RepID=A0A4R2IK54_9PSEU|nr:TetR/AcrR family transcriptional regulator [Actinocrispum wychmicini]TCO45354.1 TetR family transcriptional regulator [Actinocrispum wychmicini]
MSTRRVRARPGEGSQLREEILRVAEELLEEDGKEEALTIRAVAQRAGVTTPSVYLHFADKEALLEAVCLRVWDELGNRTREASAEVDDPFAALASSGRAYMRFALEHPAQYRILMMRPSTSEAVQSAAAACVASIAEATALCVEAGVLRGDPDELALGLLSAVHGCASLIIAQPAFPWPDDLDAVLDHTIWMSGLGTALISRIPRDATIASADLSVELDALAARLSVH